MSGDNLCEFCCLFQKKDVPVILINGIVLDTLTQKGLNDVNVQLYVSEIGGAFPKPIQNSFIKSDSSSQFLLSYVNENFLSSQSLSIHVEKE